MNVKVQIVSFYFNNDERWEQPNIDKIIEKS